MALSVMQVTATRYMDPNREDSR